MRDEEVARKINRVISAVNLRRRALGIPVFNSKRHPWKPEDERLLGTRPDDQVAMLLRTTVKAVRHRRASLKIPACPRQIEQQRQVWTEQEDEVVRKFPADEAVRRLHRTRAAVLVRRRILGIRQSIHRGWTAEEDALFSQFNDKEIAEKLGRTPSAVENRRTHLKIRAGGGPGRPRKMRWRPIPKLPPALTGT
jgi:hypothetical protein